MTSALLTLLLLGQLEDGGLTPTRLLITQTQETEWAEQLLDDGKHVRFGTKDKGPVHVWRPRSYSPATATTIIYLHGFYTDVDHAMTEHQLAAQFRDSNVNALFVVPEARSWRTDAIVWETFEPLLAMVEARLKVERPKGPVVVVGHSGAYRTIAGWLADEALERVVLIDGLYGNEDEFRAWLDASSTKPRQLVLVGFDTQQRIETFLKKHPTTAKLESLPYLYDELPRAMKKAQLLNLQSERFDHMSLVTNGRLIPWLLHALR